MKTLTLLLSALLLLCSCANNKPVVVTDSGISPWKSWRYPQPFDASQVKTHLSFIHVEGNRFVDEAGVAVVFRGLNVSDPARLAGQGKWTREHFEVIKSWGANIVRLPVHPSAWRANGKDKYFALIDQAVHWAGELDMYLIIDWHSIGNIETGLFQNPMYNTSKQETMEFWRSVAFRYKGVSTIAFYEIFNEPTDYNHQLGVANWDEWKAFNEDVISIIYAHDKNVVPLVAGFNWAYDLSEVKNAPINRKGIGYVSHPYPQKTAPPFIESWEKTWGYVADNYPVILTEIGFLRKNDRGAHVPVIVEDLSYANAITAYAKRKGISWTAWCFDPSWAPSMISDWDYTPTWQGEFFRDVMLKENK